MSRSPRCNVAVNCTRWQKYLAASLAGTAIGLGSQLDLDADITVVEVGATIADRTPDDGYFDVFGPYTFGQPVRVFGCNIFPIDCSTH